MPEKKKQKTIYVTISGENFIKKFYSMRKAYAYLLWYDNKINSHARYTILSATGRILESDTL